MNNGKLPTGWALKSVESLCAEGAPVRYGILQPGPDVEEGVFYLRPTEIQDDKIHPGTLRKTTPAIANQYRRSSLLTNDIILSIVGTIGKVAVVPEWLEGGNITQSSARIRADTSQIRVDFLADCLRSPMLVEQFGAVKMGTAVTRLNIAHVRALQIPVPPLPEQERIVAILDEAFEGIATATAHAERNLHNARELFQSVLQSTFQQKGEDWVETTLKDEVDFAAGFAFKSKGYVKNGEDGIRLLRGDNIMQGEFRWESAALWPSDDVEAYTKFHLEENDVVLAMDRPWVSAGLKISCVSSEDLPCLQVQRTARLRVGDKLSWQYLFHLLRSREFIDYILGGQTGLGVPHISGKQILSFHFGRPPIKQQKAIVKKLDALATETRRLEAIYQRKLAALAELKQSLLQRAFAGQL